MSCPIKHECGIAMIRLLKPLEYYLTKYGTALYGLNKLYLLMEKQHNRGQDGAGMASIKFDMQPGQKYLNRIRSNSNAPIRDIFDTVYNQINEAVGTKTERMRDVNWLKDNCEFYGNIFLGHLRYGTYGKNKIENCHPFIRENYWMSKNLVIAGNFNLTNVGELFQKLVDIGQHPIETSDTVTILEKIGRYLDEENEDLYRYYRNKGYSKKEISPFIAEDLDIQKILIQASQSWDGGYVIAGMLGHGDAFVLRDPHGIRPAFYYSDDEVIVVASERPVIQTVFNVHVEHIKEINPGNALIIKKNGKYDEYACHTPEKITPCSFERIYFSRGTDKDIYNERKMLGRLLAPAVLKAINYDLDNTVFSYIPNTAATAFYGLIDELNNFLNIVKKDLIINHGDKLKPEIIEQILNKKVRIEKVAVKDAKLRTFITADNTRDDLVAHVYDVTYGIVRDGIDNLVVIDDSIVRGTTLKQSIVKMLDRLNPKSIVIASSAPQIRYPDCYGIDMAKLGDFIAFKAAVELLRETHQEHVINDVYRKCKAQEHLPAEEMTNYVKDIYDALKTSQISEKVAQMVTSKDTKAQVKVLFQTIEDLHTACPNHKGDWYFTGNYPTPGGTRVVNTAFINYIKGKEVRAY